MSDALSGSAQECLYVNASLINGRWLHYKEIDDLNIAYDEFESFEELNQLIEKKVKEYDIVPREITKLSEIIYQSSSWHAVAEDWVKVYKK